MNLELKNISKTFGDKEILNNISFTVESGKAFGLLGRNGAGKTTIMRIIMNVFPPNSGKLFMNGSNIDYSRIKIGYLPEERGLYPKKRIIDQLIYFAELKNMSRKEAIQAVDYWLERLDMKEYRDRRLDTLSKGNQQKIQLITTLAHNPQIIILDEPFSGLDPVNAKLLKDIVKDEIKKDKIVLFSSHQMNYIEEFCDNIAIINQQKIVLQGNLQEIKRSYICNRLVIRSSVPEKIISDYGRTCTIGDNKCLIIKLRDPADIKSTMKDLIQRYEIDEIKVYEPSLNDIFIRYTSSQL